MSPMSARTGPSFQDPFGARLRLAVITSLLVNIVLWRAAAAFAKHPPHFDLKPVEITRVVIDTKGHKIEKIITKKQIEHKIAQVRKHVEPPRQKPPTHIAQHEAVPTRTKPRAIQIAQKPPSGAHNRVITAKPDPHAQSNPDDHTALSSGNAAVGKAIDQQNQGNAVSNPTEPAPQPPPKPEPPPVQQPAPKADSAPPPQPTPKSEPATQPEPKPEPKAKGPTRDAEPDPDSEVKPEIPDELKNGDYKSFVRAKVSVAEDGSFTIEIYKSSGNSDIDNRVLEALKKWKWRPALRNGVPTQSNQRFKFEFEVQ